MDITMPQLGETVTEGTVTRWLKEVGDQVAPDELIFEVSTDKVDSEVPSPGGGYLVEILVPEGETVAVGTRLAVIGDAPPGEGGGDGAAPAEAEAPAEAGVQEAPGPAAEAPAPEAPAAESEAESPAAEAKPEAPAGDGAAQAPAAAAPAEAPAEPAAGKSSTEAADAGESPVPEAASAGGGVTPGSEADEPAGAQAEREAAHTGEPAPQAEAPRQAEQEAPAGADTANGSGGGGAAGMLLSPVVRRLINENGLDPGDIPGTGEGGRITRSDVLGYIDKRGGAAKPAASSPTAAPERAPAAAPAPPAAPAEAPAPAPAAASAPTAHAGGDEVVPFDNIRRRTAEHMVRSKHTSAHVLTAVDVDFERVERARSARKADWKGKEGFSLTYLPFIARAVCDAIADFPHVNASVGDNQLVVHRYVNLGIAVDIDFKGLIVPVVKGAEGKRLRQIARDVRDLAERARIRKLTPDDVTGGTFTITNPGPMGTLISAPVINQPQVAILSTEGVKKRPVVVEGPEGDSIAIHHVGILALSWDHRAIDGAYAAAFLNRLREIIETRDWDAELI